MATPYVEEPRLQLTSNSDDLPACPLRHRAIQSAAHIHPPTHNLRDPSVIGWWVLVAGWVAKTESNNRLGWLFGWPAGWLGGGLATNQIDSAS